jgi:hypothetical protein
MLEPVVHLLHVPIEVDLAPVATSARWTHAVLFRTLGTRTLRVNSILALGSCKPSITPGEQ